MNFKILISFIFLFFTLFKLTAQPDRYQFSRLNSDQGLSNNQVNCILKDNQGFLWFGTMTGLNRYDGYQFKTFRHDIRNPNTLQDNYISQLFIGPDEKLWVITRAGLNIYNPATESFYPDEAEWLRRYGLPASGTITKVVKDKKGNYWFVHSQQGLFKYSPQTKTTRAFRLGAGQITDLSIDKQGNPWVIYTNGVLEKLTGNQGQVTYRNPELERQAMGKTQQYRLFADAAGDLWIYADETPQGVYFFQQQQKTFRHIHREAGGVRLNNDLVRSITQDASGKIWIATDHGGINVLDKNTFTVQYLLHNSEDEKTIGQNSIYCLYRDDTDIIWAGTYKAGISYYHENSIKFALYQRQPSNPGSLPFNDINRFVEDAKGNLWIGTNGGGLVYFDRTHNRYQQYLHDPQDPNSLSNNVIVGLYLDRDQKLWIGTYFGGLDVFDGKKFTHYQHDPDNPNSLSDNRVWEIFEDSRRNLWVGTLGGGLELFDRQKQVFRHHRLGAANSVHSDYINYITEDKAGNLWVATAYGVDKLDRKTGRFQQYVNKTNSPNGLSNNNVVTVIEDSRGLIWIGTNEGLNILDKATQTFRIFRKENGLPDNSILGIVEDSQHTIWLATQNGLSNVTLRPVSQAGKYTFAFENYDVSDGLQGKAFNNNAFLKTRSGELIFGGSNGFNRFYPGKLIKNTRPPKVVLTDFSLFNQSIRPGDTLAGRVLLPRTINQLKEVTLQHHQNMFSVTFAALNYLHPEKNQYAYQLSGFNDQWLAVDNTTRKATFTNLDPGTYILNVKAANNDGYWNQQATTLKITILPPFWKTNLALALYLFFILLTLLIARRIMLGQERLKYKLAQERQEAQRRHELDVLKIKFFTNVSHEFRTPLTLILAPLEKMLKEDGAAQGNQLQLIYRNARRLLNLVNQLLDFRKMEVQEIALHATEADVIPFVREIAFSFSDLSERKHIEFNLVAQVEQLIMFFDQDKLEKILFNLLSNAFKFTPEGGQVTVELQIPEPTAGGAKNLAILVRDTGIGISPENQEKIFKRFFQSDVPGSMVNQGSGIGLAITKKFVKLHGGSIQVQSTPDQGSCFTVLLPITAEAVLVPVATPANTAIRMLPAATPLPNIPVANGKSGKKPLVLLIEDNEDFRFYLKDNLSALYRIEEAANGKQGWQQIVALMPDLIVSDVVMPEMDGIALSRKIKKDARTTHIPVILLTANDTEEQKLLGYQTGASDYMTKPFNFELLASRIKNLISQQHAFRNALQHKMEVKPEDIVITPLDEKLIRKAIAIAEKNIANPDFSVVELSRELGMSRVYLYKKLLAVTGKAPLEFIRTVRLKRAAQLLTESQLTVAEIAYEVGFNNPKYFTKYFKMEYNVLPSAYATAKRVKV